MNRLTCSSCSQTVRTGSVYPYRCRCGGLWAIQSSEVVYPDGEAVTPLWEDPEEEALLWKREDLNPTGSFKDRGAASLAEVARASGATSLVLDSSGSAALAAASAAAALHLPLTVHTPRMLSPVRKRILEFLGCEVVAEGNREDAGERARRASEESFYFSHVYHPAFFWGTAIAAWEALRQVKQSVPRIWMLPVGNGSLFLGQAAALRGAERYDLKLIAVQASSCPGLRAPGSGGTTHAAGIAISDPPRREEILKTLGEFNGWVIEVDEEEIRDATRTLGRRGVLAEPAAAAVLAGVRRFRAGGDRAPILGWLTGSGLRG